MDILLCGRFDDGERETWHAALSQAWPAGRWLDVDAARARPETVRAAVVVNRPCDCYVRLRRVGTILATRGKMESFLWTPATTGHRKTATNLTNRPDFAVVRFSYRFGAGGPAR